MLMNKWFLYALLLIFAFDGSAQNQQPLKNVLFIMVDDLRPELKIYGQSHIKSPNIDALASEGITFNRAYCNVPVCGASRASLLSGIRPTATRFLKYNASDANDFDNAKKYYDKAIELNPKYTNAYINLAALILGQEESIIDEMLYLMKNQLWQQDLNRLPKL